MINQLNTKLEQIAANIIYFMYRVIYCPIAIHEILCDVMPKISSGNLYLHTDYLQKNCTITE